MKTRRAGAVLVLTKSRCKKKLQSTAFKWGRRILFAALVLLIFQLGKIVYSNTWKSETQYNSEEALEEDVHYVGRKLLSEGVVWEQCHFEKDHTPHAFLPLYIFLIFLLFVAIAIICDDFFVPSLEAISEKLNLSEDVAGATFMAAGSSAPELFTSVAGVGVESDVGVGTIVGSAMFNILIIVALSAVLAGQTLNLDWRPLFRDAFVYGLSIAFFIGFAWDGQFQWWEALILLLIYVAYIVIMKFNKYLLRLLEKVECKWCRNESRIEPDQDVENGAATEEVPQTNNEDHDQRRSSSVHSLHKHQFVHSHRGELSGSFANRRRSVNHTMDDLTSHASGGTHHSEHKHHFLPHIEPASEHHHHETPIKEEGSNVSEAGSSVSTAEEAVLVLIPFLPAIRATPPDPKLAREEGKLGWVKFVLKWILFVLSFPFVVLFTWTIPNCSENRKWYVVAVSFTMSIFWIAVISFAMVTLVARVGCILNIDQFVMGLVVVAIGTSVPDCLSSILVARDGFGDMAVSNAIGSNVFDVNLGLGLPFLIRIAIQAGAPFKLFSDDHMATSYVLSPHVKFGFLLLLILMITIITLTVFRFRLNKWTGLSFVVIYVLFLVYAFIQELVPACNRGRHC